MTKAMTISAMVAAKGKARRAARQRAETIANVAKYAAIGFLCVSALIMVGAVAGVGHYLANYVY